MDVLQRLTFRTLKLNRKRTIVTIIGIILASALITAVANVAESLRASMIEYEREQNGDFHYMFGGVAQENRQIFENNRAIQKLGYIQNLGYAPLKDSKLKSHPYLYITAMDENGMNAASIELLEGRMPESPGEIAVSIYANKHAGAGLEIGDTLNLTLGRRERDGEILGQNNNFIEGMESFIEEATQEYTVVGFIDRPIFQLEYSTSPGYTCITYFDPLTNEGPVDIYATYTKEGLRDRIRVTAGLLGVSVELYEKHFMNRTEEENEAYYRIASNVERNAGLIRMEEFHFSEGTMNMLYSMSALALLIIMATSVFCIHNSFTISLTEKMKLYGMLSSVGTTKKQMRRLVYQEGLLLGIVGIPLGILSGTLATYLVIQISSTLLVYALDIPLVFVISIPSMVLGAVLSAITIYLSAGQSARRASKVSPITAIRGNEMITEKDGRKRRGASPKAHKASFFVKVISRIFGIGGVIAYKNLRRARVKYRTTVVAIVVSVAVYISMSVLLDLGFVAAGAYYEEQSYNLTVRLSQGDTYNEEVFKKAQEILQMEGVEKAEIGRITFDLEIPAEEISYNNKYKKDFPWSVAKEGEVEKLAIVSIGDEAFYEYCRELRLSAEDMNGKAVLISDYTTTVTEDSDRITYKGMMYDYQPGDVITGTCREEQLQFEIASHTDKRPMRLEKYGGGFLVVSDSWMEAHKELIYPTIVVPMICDDAFVVENAIEESMGDFAYHITNYEEEYRSSQSLFILISIFLYGFIIVITLIGVTNIFNTITTNMELRSREFAMLKSVGMTRKEFGRMVRLENVFYGMKSLSIGIPLGCLLSYGFYQAMGLSIEMAYRFPWKSILISIAVVALLLAVIMRYSMGKINRKNIIETILNENI